MGFNMPINDKNKEQLDKLIAKFIHKYEQAYSKWRWGRIYFVNDCKKLAQEWGWTIKEVKKTYPDIPYRNIALNPFMFLIDCIEYEMLCEKIAQFANSAELKEYCKDNRLMMRILNYEQRLCQKIDDSHAKCNNGTDSHISVDDTQQLSIDSRSIDNL